MSRPIVEHKEAQFILEATAKASRALNNAAIAILRLSNLQVPHATGNLQSTHLITKFDDLHYEVSYNSSGLAPYARRLEFNTGGVDKRGRSYPPVTFKEGRKDHYLSDPGDEISKQMPEYFKREEL